MTAAEQAARCSPGDSPEKWVVHCQRQWGGLTVDAARWVAEWRDIMICAGYSLGTVVSMSAAGRLHTLERWARATAAHRLGNPPDLAAAARGYVPCGKVVSVTDPCCLDRGHRGPCETERGVRPYQWWLE